ncbi:MAG: CYTH domain-containing protein [Clostridiales bacterium]|nr:CYTH domain-containing protein [Clostridiales bacterium]
MEIEKEVRYNVTEDEWQLALSNSTEYKPKAEMLDITLGAFGRDSVAKTGKVFRVRKKPNKITLEIKNRIDGGWQEEAIVLDSVERGINFLTLAGLKPYLFIDRTREVRKYKGLKIFFDDIKLLGKYIEIEYQDSENATAELIEFCNICNIFMDPEPLYGDIINKKYNEDETFRTAFDQYLEDLLK